jgi:hypothetical protein
VLGSGNELVLGGGKLELELKLELGGGKLRGGNALDIERALNVAPPVPAGSGTEIGCSVDVETLRVPNEG